MRNSIQTLIGILILSFSPLVSHAQDFGLLHSILDQLDSTQRADYITKLFNDLDVDETVDSLNFSVDDLGDGLDDSGVVDSLTQLISGDNPIAGLDSLSFEWMNGRDYLSDLVDSTNSDTFDISTILGEYDFVNGQWNQNLDSLTNIFDTTKAEITIIDDLDVDDPPSQDFDSLSTYFNPGIDTTTTGGLGGDRFDRILGLLFSRDLFTNLELAYGQKNANIRFYNEPRANKSEVQVIRVGSVPSFKSLWEARWHASGSFTNSTTTILPDGTSSIRQEFNPLVMDFDYAVMYNPGFRFGPLSFRYISGLGIEAAMYAPSHFSTLNANTSRRLGNTVGYGPQISTGFSLTQGDITTYAIASAAYGSVVCGDMLDHNYSSIKYEAGVRYSNIINIRYSVGEQSWTADLDDNTGKRVRTDQRFTVGLMLESLFK